VWYERRVRFAPLQLGSSELDWSRAYIMGVLNVTPDSFSDGGRFSDVDAALRQAQQLAGAGADILDIGGESTAPRAREVSSGEEIDRVCPVIERVVATVDVPVSVDTTKASVARAAVGAGAVMVNDVSGGLFDDAMIDTVADLGAAYVCSHLRGSSIADVHGRETAPPSFDEVVGELLHRLEALPAPLRARTIADPGIGFGKPPALNVELLRRIDTLIARVDRPVLVGPSRKRFLGTLTGEPVDRRDAATVGAALAAVTGGAHLVRVHSVQMMRSALVVFEAIRTGVRG